VVDPGSNVTVISEAKLSVIGIKTKNDKIAADRKIIL